MAKDVHLVDIPSHVPAALVQDYPLLSNTLTRRNPWTDLAAEVHRGPPVIFATSVHPSGKPGWVVRRADDLRAIYGDLESFHKKGFSRIAEMLGESWDVIPTELDPPRHTAFRRSLDPMFSPKRMAARSEVVRRRARVTIDRFAARGECEFVAEMALPFPVSIFLDLIGLPQEEMATFIGWEKALKTSLDQAERLSAARTIKDYILKTIEKRRRQPGEDIISEAMKSEVDGRQWTDTEIFGFCFNLFLGGLDTVAANLAAHALHLATHPKDQQWMRNNRRQLIPAIEELLRAYSVVSTWRICSREYEVGGVRMMPGDFVAMSTTLAGRDPEAYTDPDCIDFERKPNHLAFGHAARRCLGQHLARFELQHAYNELFDALPAFRVAPGFEPEFLVGSVIQLNRLPLIFDGIQGD
jgi:cytochrome P450